MWKAYQQFQVKQEDKGQVKECSYWVPAVGCKYNVNIKVNFVMQVKSGNDVGHACLVLMTTVVNAHRVKICQNLVVQDGKSSVAN